MSKIANDKTFAKTMAGIKGPVLMDVWASWCGPCQELAPVLREVMPEYKTRLTLLKVNIDRSPKVASRFRVSSIPTLVLIHGGQPISRKVGALEPDELRGWLERALKKIAKPGPRNRSVGTASRGRAATGARSRLPVAR
jgi:thioredoxin 2